MDFLKITFPVSGVETWVFLPPLITFFLAFFGVMGGITGAFLLLPVQFSILHYTSPGVSATNLLYNLFTIPPALWRYWKEDRLNVPLSLIMIGGVVPGMFLGYLLRIHFLASPKRFRFLVGFVLLYLSFRVFRSLGRRGSPLASGNSFRVEIVSAGWRHIYFRFGGREYGISVPLVATVSTVVGIVGGAYGIGGGAILAPFLVSILGLPVHAVSGTTLATTLTASIFGIVFYTFGPGAGAATRPDPLLAALFGAGGLLGAYWGARLQKRIPERPIKWGLFFATAAASLKYLVGYFIFHR
ncbi:sulfite exporter TauE/SafE family protein [Thermosulfurimonas sp. F29]|uniref:sulfite exporter TauE/SafE family protein n=1 Tax=Thermosulfurimonas sp. F29 TaxID=2867247 RepID=UPI001C82EA92|nr:sulfite exporter TauE/SafE family protein [Thermosulfurimonas sp. F29]MBX6424089.1 sulfite exporter TauE/SafE family protein [Thermosulfurimonas sp. F29]